MEARTLYSEAPDDQTANVSEAMDSMVDEASLIEWLLPLEPEEAR